MTDITVITLTKNSEKYLHDTIKSVIHQKGLQKKILVEHLFVYANSSDATLHIIEHYKKDHPEMVHIVFDDEEKGISNAMNIGIQNARGKIISFLHSDDMYDNRNVFKTVLHFFRKHREKKWVYSSFKLMDESGRTTKKLRRTFDYGELLQWCIVPHPCVFMKKELFDEFGLFSTKYKCAMDYEYWLRISMKYKPHTFTRKYFSRFRIHKESTTEKHSDLSQRETKEISKMYEHEYRRLGLIP